MALYWAAVFFAPQGKGAMATVPQPVPQGPPASIPIQLTFDYGNLLNDKKEVVRPLTCIDIFDEDLCRTLTDLQENATGLSKEIDEYVKANEAEIERLTKLVEASTSAEVTKQLNATINKLQAENSRLKGIVASTNTYVGGIRTELSKKRKLGSVAIDQSGAGQGGVGNVMEEDQEQEEPEGIDESLNFEAELQSMLQQVLDFKRETSQKPKTRDDSLQYQQSVQKLRQNLLQGLIEAANVNEITGDEYTRLVARLDDEIRGLESRFK